MGVWNSSRQTVQEITPVLRARSLGATETGCDGGPGPGPSRSPCLLPAHILTSQDFSWLQKGQVNCVSSVPVTFFLGGGFRLDLRRPMAAGTGADTNHSPAGGGGGAGP